jgi:hypothetical protein
MQYNPEKKNKTDETLMNKGFQGSQEKEKMKYVHSTALLFSMNLKNTS